VGHKILLSVAGYIARECLVIGLTGPELLRNKKYAEALESYSQREQNVESFVNYVYPSLPLRIEMINDIYGPTATIEEIDALVVSQETASGALEVNKKRKELGWHELKVYEIKLIPDESIGDKVSSTELRRRALQSKKPGVLLSNRDDDSKL
jgi:pantetheine-phosphate adenylyltransferase